MRLNITTTILIVITNMATFADIFEVNGLAGSHLDFPTSGFVDFNDREGSPGTILNTSASLEIDWVSQSARFNSVSFSFSGDTYSRTRSYTTGPGQTTAITASIHLDPFTIEATNLGTFDITPSTGGQYDVNRSQIGAWGSLPVTGHIEVVGPTESETVPFSLSLLPNYTVFASLKTIGTTDYPDSVELNFYDNSSTWLGNWYYGNQTTLIDTIVDGIDVQIETATNGSIIPYISGPIEMQAIPEPSTIVLLSGSGFALYALRRKAKR